MRVVVSGDILTDRCQEAWKLHRLFSYACEGRHVITVDPGESLSAWLSKLDETSRSSYERAFQLALRAAPAQPVDVATVRIETTTTSAWNDPEAILSLDDALRVLDESLAILVENAENDWKFLLGIMRRSERERIQRAVSNRWAQPVHGGGDTLKTQLETRLKLSPQALRTFVLFDCDRLHPDEHSSQWTPIRPGQQPSACQAFELENLVKDKMPSRYWMLQRRFIESYLPREELGPGAAKKTPADAVEEFYKLSQPQRWYFNMKEGFDGDARRHDRERRGTLYREDQMLNPALRVGFGRQLANQYSHAVQREFNWDA